MRIIFWNLFQLMHVHACTCAHIHLSCRQKMSKPHCRIICHYFGLAGTKPTSYFWVILCGQSWWRQETILHKSSKTWELLTLSFPREGEPVLAKWVLLLGPLNLKHMTRRPWWWWDYMRDSTCGQQLQPRVAAEPRMEAVPGPQEHPA